MIFKDKGPETTIEEDLAALGMGNLLTEANGSKKDEKRIDVSVRSEGDGDGDDDGEGFDEELMKEAVLAFAEAEDLSDEEVNAVLEDGDLVVQIIEAYVGEQDDDDEDEDEDEDEEEEEDEEVEEVEEDEESDEQIDEQTAAAFAVLEAFYKHLNENEQPTVEYDDLVAVLEAYEHLTNFPAGLEEAMAAGGVGVGKKVFRHGERMRITGKNIRQGKKKARAEKKCKGKNRMLVQQPGGGYKCVTKSAGQKRAQRKLGMGKKGRAKRKRHARRTKAQNSDTRVTNPIEELVHNLAGLRDVIQESQEVRETTSEVREGFDAIAGTAAAWMGRIAEEVKDAGLAEDEIEKDPRVRIGRHLESIARDAARFVEAIDNGALEKAISEGGTTFEEVAEDLQSLAADLEETAEAMKQVD